MSNQPIICDSHAHYDSRQFNVDRDKLLNSMPNVGCVINVGCDIPSSKASIALAEKYNDDQALSKLQIYATVGVHPHEAKSLNDKSLQTLESLCSNERVVAFGEIGLDFYRNLSPQDTQRHWFKQQLDLANKLNLPVVIHSRDAGDETFDIIEKSPVRKGVIHSYSGDAEMALDYVALGFYIGISGVITYDKTKKLQGVVAAIPIDKILIETDAPYLTPVPYRGKRNESSYLRYVAESIATIKGTTPENVCTDTYKNAHRLFGIAALEI